MVLSLDTLPDFAHTKFTVLLALTQQCRWNNCRSGLEVTAAIDHIFSFSRVICLICCLLHSHIIWSWCSLPCFNLQDPALGLYTHGLELVTCTTDWETSRGTKCIGREVSLQCNWLLLWITLTINFYPSFYPPHPSFASCQTPMLSLSEKPLK